MRHLYCVAVYCISTIYLTTPDRALADEVCTPPVGYIAPVSLNSTHSATAIPGSTDVSISLPLNRESVFSGKIQAVSGSNLTIQGAGFSAGEFTTTPHLLEIESGGQTGVVGLIVSHSATTCSVELPGGLSFNGVLAGDAITIRKAWTIQSLFTNATFPVGTMLFLWSGTIPGINLSTDTMFEFDGTDWLDMNNFEPANSTVLYPGERIVIRTTGPVSNFTMVGEVPTHRFRAPLVNVNATMQQDIAISYNSPVPELLADMNLAATAIAGDQLLIIDNAATGINKSASQWLEFDGSSWWDVMYTGDDVTNSFLLGAGMSMVYRRMPSATSSIWDQTPAYLPLE